MGKRLNLLQHVACSHGLVSLLTKRRFRLAIHFETTPPPPVYGQNGLDLSFSPCFACWHMGTLLSSPSFTSTWGTQKGCDNDIFRAVFPSIWVSWDPQTLQNKGKRKMTNRPFYTPPHPLRADVQFWGISLN